MSNIQLIKCFVFLILNHTIYHQASIAEIAKAKPQKLFVVADGPCANHPEDVEKCAAARAVIERVG